MTPTGRTRLRRVWFKGWVLEHEVVITVCDELGAYGAGTHMMEITRWVRNI